MTQPHDPRLRRQRASQPPRRRVAQAHPRTSTRSARGPLVALGAVVLVLVGLASLGQQGHSGPVESPQAVAGRPTPSPELGSPGQSLASPTTVATSTPIPLTAAPVVGRFGEGLLIADRGNGRLLIVSEAGRALWTFPVPGSLPAGQQFNADDAFLSPDGRTIVTNDEEHQVIDRIDIVSRRVIWQYGHYGRTGFARGYLHTPDDAYPLANGNITVADIGNCRIIEINEAKTVIRQWGRTGHCTSHPPTTYAHPNGDTPLADGGILVTEIGGSRIVRLSASGQVLFDIHAPVLYPSDAQLDRAGNVLVVDYSSPGVILKLSPTGMVLWRYGPRSGPGMLDHPSLAIELADGTIAVNDDFRHRVVVIDPRTGRIIWQYGRTDRASRAAGFLFIPDGIDLIPAGTPL